MEDTSNGNPTLTNSEQLSASNANVQIHDLSHKLYPQTTGKITTAILSYQCICSCILTITISTDIYYHNKNNPVAYNQPYSHDLRINEPAPSTVCKWIIQQLQFHRLIHLIPTQIIIHVLQSVTTYQMSFPHFIHHILITKIIILPTIGLIVTHEESLHHLTYLFIIKIIFLIMYLTIIHLILVPYQMSSRHQQHMLLSTTKTHNASDVPDTHNNRLNNQSLRLAESSYHAISNGSNNFLEAQNVYESASPSSSGNFSFCKEWHN